ncbi:MAG: hypothetical protein HY898_12635 [Deltaproteobacteria bacterium]|nr:hypothetical protein [Deltaproteobacteria bacterium]
MERTGGDPDLYRAPGDSFFVPPTFFAAWALPEFARVLAVSGLPFNFVRTLHAASSVQVHRLTTCEEPLNFTASVEAVQRTGDRTRIDLKLEQIALRGQPVLTATLSLVLPSRRKGARRAPELLPESATRLDSLELGPSEGWRYARLSGDFNPVHWSRSAARLSGLPGPIAHGFNVMTRVCHVAVGKLAGKLSRFGMLEVAFRKPISLPATLGLWTGQPDAGTGRIPLWVAAGPGAITLLTGHVELVP